MLNTRGGENQIRDSIHIYTFFSGTFLFPFGNAFPQGRHGLTQATSFPIGKRKGTAFVWNAFPLNMYELLSYRNNWVCQADYPIRILVTASRE